MYLQKQQWKKCAKTWKPNLKVNTGLHKLKCELAEEGRDEVALCSLESVTKELSYHGPPTDEWSFSSCEVSGHSVYPYFSLIHIFGGLIIGARATADPQA